MNPITEVGMYTRWLESKRTSALETVNKFASELPHNPEYAFRWADDAAQAAAMHAAVTQIKHIIDHGRSKGASEAEVVATVKKHANETVLRLARSGTNRSTSPSSNLMADMSLRVWGEIQERTERIGEDA